VITSTWTCELRQHLFDRWYAGGHGKFLPFNLISPGITNKIENTIFTVEHIIVENKQILDPENNENLCYCIEQGLCSLDPEVQEDIWFTCNVMPAVGKIGNHIMQPGKSSLNLTKLLACFF